MKLIDKMRNFKVNFKIVIIMLTFMIVGVIGYGINYCFYSPSPVNKYIASNLYKEPANSYFDDDNFYQCVVDAYNEDNKTNLPYTTNLSDSQLETITSLNCYNKGIVSAKGIEKLTGLKTLFITKNQLTSLDVSKNISLVSLYAEENNLINIDLKYNFELEKIYLGENQLTSLDVSKNTKLLELDIGYWCHSSFSSMSSCYGGNQLTDLYVSENTVLERLYVSNNQLTSLDVSKNKSLIDLYVSYNQLKSLDVSENTALLRMKVTRNQLTSLDVGKNNALTELDANYNQLTSLNVRGATALTYLSVYENQLIGLDVSGATALTELHAFNNQLTSLDVSGATALTELSVSDNQLRSLDVGKNTSLKKLYAYNNQLTNLDVSNNTALIELDVFNNQLTNLDVSKNIALTKMKVYDNQLTNLDVSNNTALTELYVFNNQLTNLDISNNQLLTELYVFNNQLISLDVSGATALVNLYAEENNLVTIDLKNNFELKKIYLAGNKLTSLDISKNTKLLELDVGFWCHDSTFGMSSCNGGNQLTNLDTSNNVALKYLYAPKNQLTSLDLSKNIALTKLDVSFNQLTSLDLSKNIALTALEIYSNRFEKSLVPILLGTNLKVDTLEKIVKIPKQFVTSITTTISDGLEMNDNILMATKPGIQTFVVTSKMNSGVFLDTYTETYIIEVVDIKSNKYDIDKTKDYIVVGNDNDDDVLSNITVENGTATIDDGYLIVKNGDDEVKRFELIRFSSSVYDLTNDYIYVDNDTDEEIKNNIEATADISIDNNTLIITYGDTYNVSYTLVRLNTKYDISNGYIYTFDRNYLDNINIINGSNEIVDSNLIIKYNDIEIKDIPILNISSNDYIIKEDYIYTGLSDIDLNKINKHKDLDLSINDNKLILTYKDNIIDEIPYYYLISNSNDVRFSTVNNKIYVKNTMMTYNQLLQYIIFNYGGQSIILFDKNGNRITDNNLLIEEESYITLYGNTDMKHIIEVNTEYVEYKVGTNIHYTAEYGKDIIKNLNNNNTFINVRDLIETDGDLSILDEEDNVLEETSNIKTGDKFVVTFPSSNKYYIYLSIKGDVTGKGNITDEDVLKSYSILRGNVVEDYYRLASDINDDGRIKINDVAKLHQYVGKKIDSLED